MKRAFTFYCQILLVLQASATHISYEDMTYKWLSGTTYEFTLTIYRDCAPGSAAAPSTVMISVCNSSGAAGSFAMAQIAGTGIPVFPVCSYPLSYCVGGTDAGFQKYVYRGTHNMGSARSDWKFYHTYCCRETGINTISTPLSTGTGIIMTMDNLNFPGNSSPVFNDEPVLFACCNQGWSYDQSATDIDGDSLHYSLNHPWNDLINCIGLDSVNYTGSYSASAFLTSSPAMSMDPLTGYLTMYPSVCTEISVMGIKVEEYRGGVLIGSITRDNMVMVTNQTAGVEENVFSDFSVSPNPSSGKVFVSLPNVRGRLSVVNAIGEIVLTADFENEKELDLKGISAGIYLIELLTKDQIRIEKLMVD